MIVSAYIFCCSYVLWFGYLRSYKSTLVILEITNWQWYWLFICLYIFYGNHRLNQVSKCLYILILYPLLDYSNLLLWQLITFGHILNQYFAVELQFNTFVKIYCGSLYMQDIIIIIISLFRISTNSSSIFCLNFAYKGS